jgi:excinuclease UvrABC nuclease subunit
MDIKLFQKLKLPSKPGVYFFQKGGKTLYIGKATSLRDRVRSYFGKDLIQTRGPLLVDMVFKADKIIWQPADTVLEALILEANLIKKHQPYYNTKEKDDKSFNYVCITKEELPKVLVVRGKELLQGQKNFAALPSLRGLRHGRNFPVPFASVFGPYTNGMMLREALKIIQRIFPYLDASSSKKPNYEFYRQIGLAPDITGKVAPTETYLQNIKYLKMFFQGRKKDIARSIKKQMMAEAKARNFERASELKDQLFALEHINDIALLKREKEDSGVVRIEAYDIAHMSGKNMVGVMVALVGGEMDKNSYRKFNIKTQSGANDTGALREVLERRLAHQEWEYPSIIVLDGGAAQLNAGLSVLEKNRIKIPMVSVVKDDKHKARAIMGPEDVVAKYKKDIILANAEAHRFAIAFHKNKRGKSFLP